MLSVIIPTYNREKILCDSIRMLLEHADCCDELLVMDQTPDHEPETLRALNKWNEKGQIRWVKLAKPSITASMNRGALEAKGNLVLFLDDDIIPSKDLISAHREAHQMNPDAWAIVGQVLQPENWDKNHPGYWKATGKRKSVVDKNIKWPSLKKDLDFPFYEVIQAWTYNVIACNLSVKKEKFLQIGGFDEHFTPPVAFRFETEFARRTWRNGGKILFEPKASIRHLQARSGGTRSKGSHYNSASPIYGVGDYYFALREGKGIEVPFYWVDRCFRHCRSRFLLKNPWWIPIKFIGEIRAMKEAVSKYRAGQRFIHMNYQKIIE